MKNGIVQSRPHKLFSLLELIDDDELYRLKRYINADYFNTNIRIKLLFNNILEAKHNCSTFCVIDPVQVYYSTFPENNNRAITDDFSSLMKLVKGYLSQEVYNNDNNAKTRNLADAYAERKAEKLLLHLLNKEAQHYEKPTKSKQLQAFPEYYHNWYMAQQRVNFFIVFNTRKLKDQFLKDANDTIDRFYTVVKLTYWATLEQTAQIHGMQFNVTHKALLIKLVNSIPLEACPLVHRYYETAQLNIKISEAQFLQCKAIYDQYIHRFDNFEQRQFCNYMYNISAIKSFDPEGVNWLEYKLNFMKDQFEKGYSVFRAENRKKYIKGISYFNYLKLLITLGKFKEYEGAKNKYVRMAIFPSQDVKKIYQSYLQIALLLKKHFLEIGSKPHSSFYYEQAFHQFEKFEGQISRGDIDTPNPILRILFDVLALKIYFFQNQGFTKRRNALQKYLTNFKKLNDVFKIPYLNFTNVLLLLYKLRQNNRPSPQLIADARQIIEQEKLVQREWLKARLLEIEG